MSAGPYGQFAAQLECLVNGARHDAWSDIDINVTAALNGRAAKRLRELVPRETRREYGAFFTHGPVRTRFEAMLDADDSIRRDADTVFWDPTCGAGDLLLAASTRLPLGETASQTLALWSDRLHGHELHVEFVRAARLRLVLAALERHRQRGDSTAVSADLVARSFRHVVVGDGLDALRQTTGFSGHFLLNPPFTSQSIGEGYGWSTGKTSIAAVFAAAAASALGRGGRVTAVLPDVLRSGSRYRAWRAHMEKYLAVEQVQPHGLFDEFTDIDVYLLQASVRSSEPVASADWWPVETAKIRLADAFEVRVGTVVDNRDPLEGPRVRFLTARDLPSDGVMGLPSRFRAFSGRLVDPPFVVLRRTSRPGQGAKGGTRGMGVLVTGDERIAVDNHLITLTPHRGGERECRDLLDVLARPELSGWLDQRIRCRHLTVTVVREIPWLRPAMQA